MVFIRGAREGVTVSAMHGRGCSLIRVALVLVAASLMASYAAHAGDLDRVFDFNIEAQTLDKALLDFGNQAHVQIMFASKASMGQVRTAALMGRFTVRQALEDLLRGSNYRFVEQGNTAEIVPRDWTPSGVRRGNAERADSVEKKVAPVQRHTEPETTPDPPKKQYPTSQNAATLQEVIVTGTHIRGAPVSSPVTRITRQEIDRSGYTTIGAVIQSLPDDFGNSGPQTIIGGAPNGSSSYSGAPAPNLYGLGEASTLTLVDGQRLAVDSIDGAADISLVPLPVIDHIDVLSGGASAIYGADAVAGVVNIVLLKDFEGSRTALLGGGTADGGGSERDINEMLGKVWSGGGAMVDYESDAQDPILASKRNYTSAAEPLTTTLAGTSRNSFFASGHQNLGKAVSAFATALYTHRSTSATWAAGGSPQQPAPYTADSTDTHHYAADGGLNVILPSDWSLSIVGDYSEERTDVAKAVSSSPPQNISILVEGLTKSLEASANGPILRTWSGVMRGAAGLGYRRETYNFVNAFSPQPQQTPGAHRTVGYAYGELNAPLITPSNINWRRELALDLSGRFERYSDFGNESVPKIGLVYVPFSTIHVRGTWGKAFRAPSLYQMYGIQNLYYLPVRDPLSATGVSNALWHLGGNPRLKPETARTWTIGIDYASKAVEGLRGSVTYFDIAYRDRIGSIQDISNALINPLDAPYVTRNPSEGLVQSLINSAASFLNITGKTFNPASVSALVNDASINVASEDVIGGNVDVRYSRALGSGEIEPFINVSLLDLSQKLVPGAPEMEISGLVFQPPRVRARMGASWLIQRWRMTGIVNYSGSEANTYLPSSPHVASWTTLDLDLAWQPAEAGVFSGLELNMAVQNVFNRDPPFVQFDQRLPGIHYDSLNANPLGRVIRVGASWLFK
jgi:outer membrane receptor protein involved in Fe transport